MNRHSTWQPYPSLWISVWYGDENSITVPEEGIGIVVRQDLLDRVIEEEFNIANLVVI